MKLADTFNKTRERKDVPQFKVGDTLRVYYKIKEGDKERLQAFEGLVIAHKHGKGINATFTVRKISGGIGVERIFPLHSSNVAKIERVKTSKVRRAKLYFVRSQKKKMRTVTQSKKIAAQEPAGAKEASTEKE